MNIHLNSRGSDCEWLHPWFSAAIVECGCLTSLCHNQSLPQTIFSIFHYSKNFYTLFVKMPVFPLNPEHNMYKNKQSIECFSKSFFCAWNPIFLSTYSNYRNVTFFNKVIPWQFHTCMTPVFSYLASIPDKPLSFIWSPVPTFLCFVLFCGPLSLTREFCWAWTWSYLLKPNKLTTKDNGSSSSPNL